MFQVILEERKRREVDPTLAVLRDCVASVDKTDATTRQRLGELLDFMETMDGAYREARSLAMADLRRFLKLRGGMRKVANLILSR
jgi:DNA-binding transcriptional regulator GbsR (MarR family)